MKINTSLLLGIWGRNRGKFICLALLLLLVGGALAGNRILVEPELLSLSAEKTQLEKKVRHRLHKGVRKGFPLSQEVRFEKKQKELDRLVPQEKDFSLFVGELFSWAQRSGLKIHGVDYKPDSKSGSGFLRYGLRFSVQGSYASIKKFVHLMENSERIVIIEKIHLNRADGQKLNSRVNLQIQLSTYFRGRPA